MLGRTHLTIGIATALVVTHPATVPGVLAAAAAGGIGGKLPDVDTKPQDLSRKRFYDLIIDLLFLLAILAMDYIYGAGICWYITSNWGPPVWIGIASLIALTLLGTITKHRSFTHSILGFALFTASIYFLCSPIVIPFAIGYLSHLILDFFNKQGLRLFFPLKPTFCLGLCPAKSKANTVLEWIGISLTCIVGGILLAIAIPEAPTSSDFLSGITEPVLFGLNGLELYLIFINLISFFGFQRDWKRNVLDVDTEDEDDEEKSRLNTWVLNFTVFIGGGIGMLVSLIIHLQIPQSCNATWWSFCYFSVLTWTTIYCYFCNPFSLVLCPIDLSPLVHIDFLVYLLCVNIFCFFVAMFLRKRKPNVNSFGHTLLWLLGALGGIPSIFTVMAISSQRHRYHYVFSGFPLMLVSQFVFGAYLLSAGVI